MNKEDFINKQIEEFKNKFFFADGGFMLPIDEIEVFLRQSLEEAWERGRKQDGEEWLKAIKKNMTGQSK